MRRALTAVVALLFAGLGLFACKAQPVAPPKAAAAPPAHIYSSGELAQVIVASVRITMVPASNPEGVIAQVDPVFANTGQSATVGLTYNVVETPSQEQARDGPRAQPGDPETNYQAAAAHPGGGGIKSAQIGPQTNQPIRGLDLTLPAPVQIFGRSPPAISGAIHYRDISGAAHLTKFCFFVQRGGGDTPPSSACPHWNCVDASCAGDANAYAAEVAMAQADPSGRPTR